MSKEVELKLDLDDDTSGLIRSSPFLHGAPSRTVHQISTYYDTPKELLAKRGFSLRVRSSEGAYVQTLKRTLPSEGLFIRDEWEWNVKDGELDLSKLDEISIELPSDGSKLKRKLQPVLRSEVERTIWRLQQGSSEVEVAWDVARLTAGERSLDFAEIEFELVNGSTGDVVTAARALAERVPARLGVLSKAERGAALADGKLDRVTKAAPICITADMTVAQAFAAVVHACLKHYRLNEGLVLSRRPADALHQCRVAMRRLRSAFSFFRPAIADENYLRLRENLRGFTAQLGEARNLDVYLERELEELERETASRKREEAYDHVVEAMNAAMFRLLLIDISAWTATGSWRAHTIAGRSIRGFARKRLDKLWSTIEPTRGTLAQVDEEARHTLRIQIKKMRYAAEFFDTVFPSRKRKKRFGVIIQELQESLGRLNDLATARLLAPSLSNELSPQSLGELENIAVSEALLETLCDAGPFWRAT